MTRSEDDVRVKRRARSWSWVLRLAVLLVLALVSAAPGAEGEDLLFSVKGEVQRGELIELVGPTLPTEGFGVIVQAVEPPEGSNPYKRMAVHSVEPGRIVVRVPWSRSEYWWTAEGHALQILVYTYEPGKPLPFTEWLPAESVRFVAPEPLRVEPFNARAGDVVAIHGRSMGYAPPPPGTSEGARVIIGGLDTEILSWTPEVVTVRLDDATPSGLLAVNVDGGLLGAGVLVGEPSLWSKGRRSALRISKDAGPKSAKVRVRAARYKEDEGVLFLKAFGHTTRWRTAVYCRPIGNTFIGDCSAPVRYADRKWRLLHMSVPLDLTDRLPPFTIRSSDVDPERVTFEFAVSRNAPRRFPKLFPRRPLRDWAVHVHAVDDRWIVGSFSGLADPVDSGAPEVVQGSFRIRRRR